MSDARRRAEEALATVALRYPNGWGAYDTLSVCTVALRALLAEPAPACGSVSAVRSDDPPAAPLPTCANCGSNLIEPAPAHDAALRAALARETERAEKAEARLAALSHLGTGAGRRAG